MSDQTEVPTDKAHQVAALSESELDRAFLDILSTATPAELELLASLIRAAEDRIGLSLG